MRRLIPAVILLSFLGCNKSSTESSTNQDGKSPKAGDPSTENPSEPAEMASEQGADFASRLASLLKLAADQEAQKDHSSAIGTRRRILALVQQQFGPQSWQATNAKLAIENTRHKSSLTLRQQQTLAKIADLEQQANQLEAAGRSADAASIYSEILALAPQIWPARSNALANYAYRKGQVCVATAEYAQAGELFEFALPIRKEVLGPEHPEYVATLNSLGMLYLQTKRFEDSRPLLLEAAGLTEKIWGADSLQHATQLNNLGTLWYSTGRYVDAEYILSQALDIRGRKLGKQHAAYADTLYNLGAVSLATDDYGQAAQRLQNALDIYDRTKGAEHLAIFRTASSLATARHALRQYDKAEVLLRRALAYGDSLLGSGHEATIDCRYRLAVVLCYQAKYDQAEPLFAQVIDKQREIHGDQSPRLVPIYFAFAELLDRVGRTSESARYVSEGRAIQTRTAGASGSRRLD